MRSSLLSPEFLILALAAWAYIIDWNALPSIGKLLQGLDFKSLIASGSAPVAMAAGTYKLGWDLLSPNEKHRELLLQWPSYWKLRSRVVLSLFFSLAGVIGFLAGVVLAQGGNAKLAGTLGGVGLGLGVSTLFSVALARIVLRDLLDSA